MEKLGARGTEQRETVWRHIYVGQTGHMEKVPSQGEFGKTKKQVWRGESPGIESRRTGICESVSYYFQIQVYRQVKDNIMYIQIYIFL